LQDAKSKREEERQKQLRWREENRNALLQPPTGARDSIDTMSVSGRLDNGSPGGGGAGGSAGGVRLGQLLRQKRWQQDTQLMQSGDTQDSNYLGGRGGVAEASSADTLADLPPSYASKSGTLPLDSRIAADLGSPLDDVAVAPWHSRAAPYSSVGEDAPVQAIEFGEDSGDEDLDEPQFRGESPSPPSPHCDVRSGMPTETDIDTAADYEHIQVPSERIHPSTGRGRLGPLRTDTEQSHSPGLSRRSSRSDHDLEPSTHRPGGSEPKPGRRGQFAASRADPSVSRRQPTLTSSVEEPASATGKTPYDPYESLPPPMESMMGMEEEDIEEEEEEMGDVRPPTQEEEIDFEDEDQGAAAARPFSSHRRPTDL